MKISDSSYPQHNQLYGEFNPAIALGFALAPCLMAITVIGVSLCLKDIKDHYRSFSEHTAKAELSPYIASLAIAITTIALGTLSQMEYESTLYTKLAVTALGISVFLLLSHIYGDKRPPKQFT